MVTQKEIIEALRGECNGCKRDMLADRIASKGIAPPDGMVLVPSCPSTDMISILKEAVPKKNAREIYRAMLAAAPKGVSHD